MPPNNTALSRSSIIVQSCAYFIASVALYTINSTQVDDVFRIGLSGLFFFLALLISVAIFFPGSKYEDEVLSIAAPFSVILLMVALLLVLVKFNQDKLALYISLAFLVLTIFNFFFIFREELKDQQELFGKRFAWIGLSLIGSLVFAGAGLLAMLLDTFGFLHWIFYVVAFVLIFVYIALHNRWQN